MSKKSNKENLPYETAVVDATIKELEHNKSYCKLFNVERENTKEDHLSGLLATASKKNNGKRGKCDIILTPKDKKTKTYILIECKRDAHKHGDFKEYELHHH